MHLEAGVGEVVGVVDGAAGEGIDAVGGDEEETVRVGGDVAGLGGGGFHHVFPAGAAAAADAEAQAGAWRGVATCEQGAQFGFRAGGEGDRHGRGKSTGGLALAPVFFSAIRGSGWGWSGENPGVRVAGLASGAGGGWNVRETMSRIRVLPDILASQVAAGEVVERPASVVKELVENSIDSGAREVRVEVQRGGVLLIRVEDDGCGMAREDALLSLERHATSKLRTVGDLQTIRTLGFRGEAVPSIASVSRFRMVTREAEALVGTEVEVSGGRMVDVRDAGCAPGTSIEVRDLFFNVPARRKFLKAEGTEAAHIEHQMRLHALAFPEVGFRLRSGDRTVGEWPVVRRRLDRVRQMVDRETARELIAVEETCGHGVSVEGFLLPARHARKGRRHQFVFLNGRPVEDGVVSRALLDAFRGAVPEGMHPGAWLWIGMDPSSVDVNVHPAKREVRFHRPHDLREVLAEAVAAALAGPAKAAGPVVLPAGAAGREPTGGLPVERVLPDVGFSAGDSVAVERPAAELPEQESAVTSSAGSPAGVAAGLPALRPVQVDLPDAGVSGGGRPGFRVLGILHGRFHILESDGGLVWLDPRAARERIRYERLLASAEEVASQPLLVPVLWQVDPRELDLLQRQPEAFASAGIELEPFGGNTVQIRSLPACLSGGDPVPFLHAVMDDLLHDRQGGAKFTRERLARALARRASFGEPARASDLPGLLDELFACDLPYCAPDGRPTLSEISLRELERRFGNDGRGG